jgi:hypothetical protein
MCLQPLPCCCLAAAFLLLQLMRMYFVGVSSTAPYEVDMEQVYSFDCIERSFVRHKVTTLGENHTEPVLRIRWGVVIVACPQQYWLGWAGLVWAGLG